MTYVVGQKILGEKYTVHDIVMDEEGDSVVWIKNNESGEILRWKSFNKNMAVSLEYNIDFE
jgi:hypothetical protein